MTKLTFHKMPESGWATNARGRQIDLSKYEAQYRGKRIATIEGFLRNGGGTGWSVFIPLGSPINLKAWRYSTLTEAKKYVGLAAEEIVEFSIQFCPVEQVTIQVLALSKEEAIKIATAQWKAVYGEPRVSA